MGAKHNLVVARGSTMIMAQGLFHLKRNVGAFIHVGSWYKIECQVSLHFPFFINACVNHFFSGKQIDNKKNILQWRKFNFWEQFPVTRLGTRGSHVGSWYKIECQVSLHCPFFFAPSVFSNIYLFCVLCTLCCQFLWIVLFIALRYSLTFICAVSCVPYVASFSKDNPEKLVT
jgi:hypothetical protein